MILKINLSHLSKVVGSSTMIDLSYHKRFFFITRVLLKYIRNKYINLNRNMNIDNVSLLRFY